MEAKRKNRKREGVGECRYERGTGMWSGFGKYLS